MLIDKAHADIIRKAIGIAVAAKLSDTPNINLMVLWIEEQPGYNPDTKVCMLETLIQLGFERQLRLAQGLKKQILMENS